MDGNVRRLLAPSHGPELKPALIFLASLRSFVYPLRSSSRHRCNHHVPRLPFAGDRDRQLLNSIPLRILALVIGPHQFLVADPRAAHGKLHRVQGRVYDDRVFVGAFTGIALASGRPGLLGTSNAGRGVDRVTTRLQSQARTGRSCSTGSGSRGPYARNVTLRLHRVRTLWPRYWSHLGRCRSAVGV